jgi:hypothetical protein
VVAQCSAVSPVACLQQSLQAAEVDRACR